MQKKLWVWLLLGLLLLVACGGGETQGGETAVANPSPTVSQPALEADESVEAAATAVLEAEPEPTAEPVLEPTGPGITDELDISNSQRTEADGAQLEETDDCFERLFGNGRFVLFDDGSLTYTPSDSTALSDCLLLDATELSGEYESSDEADYAYEIDDINQFAGLENVEIDVDGTITGTEGTVRFRIFPASGADRSLIQLIRADYLFNGATAVADNDALSEPETEESPSENEPTPTEMPALTSALPAINPGDYTEQFAVIGSSNMVIANELMVRFADAGYAGLPLLNLSNSTAAGIASLCLGDADGALATRTMTEDEAALCTSSGQRVLNFILARNPIVVIVNPANDWATEMRVDELVLALTTAEAWSDINNSWPDLPIERVFPGPDSFPYSQVSSFLFPEDADALVNAVDAQFSEDDTVLVSGVANSEGAISFIAHSGFAEAQGVTAVSIEGLILGSEGYLFDQPIILLTLDRVLQTNPDMAAFINFSLTDGRLALFDLGLALPDEATQQANEQAWLDAVGE
ncbi:MAG: substrate-binding domain-containing protein [Chloroflexota bacterium]